MSEEDKGIVTAPLFVGLTRPATFLGLPLNAFVINMLVVAIIFLLSKNVLLILCGIPSYLFLRYLTSKDIDIFDNLRLNGMTKGRCRVKEQGAVFFSNSNIRKIKSNQDYKEI